MSFQMETCVSAILEVLKTFLRGCVMVLLSRMMLHNRIELSHMLQHATSSELKCMRANERAYGSW